MKAPLVLILLVVLILGVIGIVYLFGNQKDKSDNLSGIKSFEECVKAGYTVMESYPRQCKTADGKYFVEETQSNSGIYGQVILSPTCPVQRVAFYQQVRNHFKAVASAAPTQPTHYL